MQADRLEGRSVKNVQGEQRLRVTAGRRTENMVQVDAGRQKCRYWEKTSRGK